MMQGYYIDEQKDGRGEDAEMVLIKEVKKGVSTDSAGKISGMFPLKSVSGKQLPCLKVVVSNGDDDHRFEVRWSNYYEQRGTNPGKFKLVFVKAKQPIFHYQHDSGNNRKIIDKRTGKPCIDFVRMATEYGSEPIMSDGKYPKVIGWNFGEKQAYTNETEEMWEAETLDGAEANLTVRFGESLAADIMCLFVDHDLFHSFYSEAVAA